MATGAATALGEIGLNKIFGKGITIPNKFITMLPMNLQNHKKMKLTEFINQEDDWLLNQQENKLKVDF